VVGKARPSARPGSSGVLVRTKFATTSTVPVVATGYNAPGLRVAPGGRGLSILLTRLYAPSGDVADLLTRQEPAIGRRS
jgi:hypothetical protein